MVFEFFSSQKLPGYIYLSKKRCLKQIYAPLRWGVQTNVGLLKTYTFQENHTFTFCFAILTYTFVISTWSLNYPFVSIRVFVLLSIVADESASDRWRPKSSVAFVGKFSTCWWRPKKIVVIPFRFRSRTQPSFPWRRRPQLLVVWRLTTVYCPRNNLQEYPRSQ